MDFNPATIAPRTRPVSDTLADLREHTWVWYVVGLALVLALGVSVFFMVTRKRGQQDKTE